MAARKRNRAQKMSILRPREDEMSRERGAAAWEKAREAQMARGQVSFEPYTRPEGPSQIRVGKGPKAETKGERRKRKRRMG